MTNSSEISGMFELSNCKQRAPFTSIHVYTHQNCYPFFALLSTRTNFSCYTVSFIREKSPVKSCVISIKDIFGLVMLKDSQKNSLLPVFTSIFSTEAFSLEIALYSMSCLTLHLDSHPLEHVHSSEGSSSSALGLKTSPLIGTPCALAAVNY